MAHGEKRMRLALAAVAATLVISPAWSQARQIPEALRIKCAAETQQWSRDNMIRGFGAGKQRRAMFQQCAGKNTG
jgi:hypothetical protein